MSAISEDVEAPDGCQAVPTTGLNARYDHIAVAAPRIRDLLPLYRSLLGGVPVRGGDNATVGYRAVQLALSDGQRVELLEPLAGSIFFDRFLARTGGGGVHHLTVAVDDIEVALKVIQHSLDEPINVALDAATHPEIFLHPKQAHGCLIQMIQPVSTTPSPVTLEQVLSGRGAFGNGVASP